MFGWSRPIQKSINRYLHKKLEYFYCLRNLLLHNMHSEKFKIHIAPCATNQLLNEMIKNVLLMPVLYNSHNIQHFVACFPKTVHP